MDWAAFSIVTITSAPMIGVIMLSEDGIVSQVRRRAFKPQPVVALACEMLASDIGWRGYSPIHETGVEVEAYSVSSARLSVGGAPVPLSPADRFRLHRAVSDYRKRAEKRTADAAAVELSGKIKLMAQRVQDMSEKVIPIGRRA